MMALAIFLIVSIILLLMAWEDFKYRAIHWFSFPIVLGLLVVFNFSFYYTAWWQILFNLGYLSLIFLLVLAYLRISGRKLSDLLSKLLGIGDVLFFIILALTLPTLVFISFFILSLIIALIIGMLVFRKTTVPLAGLQAVMLVMLLAAFQFQILNIQDFQNFTFYE